jgi:hypothetical protein
VRPPACKNWKVLILILFPRSPPLVQILVDALLFDFDELYRPSFVLDLINENKVRTSAEHLLRRKNWRTVCRAGNGPRPAQWDSPPVFSRRRHGPSRSFVISGTMRHALSKQQPLGRHFGGIQSCQLVPVHFPPAGIPADSPPTRASTLFNYITPFSGRSGWIYDQRCSQFNIL